MNKKELKRKLSEAKQYRYYTQYAEALAILHQIVAEYPEAVYYYLLAATYLEAGEKDLTMQYLDEVLNIDTNYKGAYELKAKVYESEKKYNKAEQMYLKALDIDPDFFNSRDGLICMYWHEVKDYEKTIQQCEFVFDKYNSYVFKEDELKDKFQWIGAFKSPAVESYVHLKRYDDAIKLLLRYKKVIRDYVGKGNDENTLTSEDRFLYKLYYLLGYKEKLEEQRKLWKEHYKASDSEILGMEKDTEQGYILNVNWDNYQVGKNGEIL